jgi:hypothetical protein
MIAGNALRNKGVLSILTAITSAPSLSTVILCDNGATHDAGGVDTKYFNSAGGLKGLKGSLHEGGIREPTVVRWPAGIKAGTRSNRISGFEDWLTTFAELAGVKLERAADIASESLLPALKGTDLAPFPLGYMSAGLQADLLQRIRQLADAQNMTLSSFSSSLSLFLRLKLFAVTFDEWLDLFNGCSKGVKITNAVKFANLLTKFFHRFIRIIWNHGA